MQGQPDEAEAGGYATELRTHRRALLGAVLGMGSGYLLNHYIANTFSPHLIEAFGWTRAEYALVGTLGLLSLLAIPLVGRATDLFGVRAVATVGVTVFPLTFVAFSLMDGSLATYAIIFLVQNTLAGAATSSTVYSRLIAERFVSARGVALAIAATAPALVGLALTPMLQALIDAEGWRTGYLAVAGYVGAVGGLALLIIPRPSEPGAAKRRARRTARQDYPIILKAPAFWIIFFGMLLCNLIYPLQSTQMMLMLMENGADTSTAAWMISLFAAGVMIGRIACGLALDRFPTHLVAAIALSLPAAGLLLIAAGLNSTEVLAFSVVLIGLSLGAESDLVAYLVIRFFNIQVYGSVLGLVVTSLALSATLGSIVLSATLAATDSFDAYMFAAAAASLIGGGLFLLLGRDRIVASAKQVGSTGAADPDKAEPEVGLA
jgi:MFS family permease